MHRLLRVLIGIASFAAAAFLIYTCVLSMTGDDMVDASHMRAPGAVPLQLDKAVYGFWSVEDTRSGWGAKSCGGSRNGHSQSAAVENAQFATKARLVPVGGGTPVALERGVCMRVTASSGNRQTASQFRVESAGTYRLTVPRAAANAGRFYLSTGQRFVDWLPRGVGALVLILFGVLVIAGRFRRRRGPAAASV